MFAGNTLLMGQMERDHVVFRDVDNVSDPLLN